MPEFTYTIKRARSLIEIEYEKMLRNTSPTGAIFALKNFGWKDKSEVDQNIKTSGINITISDVGADGSKTE